MVFDNLIQKANKVRGFVQQISGFNKKYQYFRQCDIGARVEIMDQ